MAWPHKILGQIENVQQQHEEDEERFLKIQMVDQSNFQERLESLEVRDSSLYSFKNCYYSREKKRLCF